MGYIGPKEPPVITPGTIANGDLVNISQYRLKGRVSSGSGSPEDLTADQSITLLNQASSSTLDAARLSSYYRTIRINGGADLSSRPRVNYISGSGVALSGADDGVDFESDITIALASIATNRVLGNVSGSSAAPTALDSDGLFTVLNSTGTAQLANNRLAALNPDPSGTYAYASITIDAQGRVTAASANATPLSASGGTVTGNLEIGTTGSLTFEGSTANGFETTLAVVDPTDDRTITLPNATGTVLLSGAVVDADIAAGAEIAVSKLADGAARQLLQTAANGTDVEWTSNVDLPGTLDVTGISTFDAATRGAVSALGAVSAGTTTLDLATANNFSLSLPAGGTVTLANPSNQTAGQSGAITITQNSGTAATVAYGTNWKFQGGAPAVSTTLSSVNVIVYYVESASRITAQLLTNTIS